MKAKDGAGSATLSMAMAGARFAESLLKAAQGQKGVIEPTFVDSPLFKSEGIDFFASKVELGPNGVEKIHEVGKITPFEQKLLEACKADLKKNIAKGIWSIRAPIQEHTLTVPRCCIRQGESVSMRNWDLTYGQHGWLDQIDLVHRKRSYGIVNFCSGYGYLLICHSIWDTHSWHSASHLMVSSTMVGATIKQSHGLADRSDETVL